MKMLNLHFHWQGPQPALTIVQQEMIFERLHFAACRGFAAGPVELNALIAQCVEVNGTPYRNGMPSEESVRTFRSKTANSLCVATSRRIFRRGKILLILKESFLFWKT